MARVTVEDCVSKIPNRFELVMLASRRARDLLAGAPLSVDRDDDKNPVVALREIAEGTVSLEVLHNSLVRSLQRVAESDAPEDEVSEFLAAERVAMRALVGEELGGEDGGEDGMTLLDGEDLAMEPEDDADDVAPGAAADL